MTQEAYNDTVHALNATIRSGIHIIVSFGAHGEQFADTRISSRGAIQVRVWRAKPKTWTKWRKLQLAEVKRLATRADHGKFSPHI